MIALFIRADVAVDVQLRMAQAAGLASVCVELSTVEALGTMRFRSLLERSASQLVMLHGEPRDQDSDRLQTIAEVLGAHAVAGAPGTTWSRVAVDDAQDLLASLTAAARDHSPDTAVLELAPGKAVWQAAAQSGWH